MRRAERLFRLVNEMRDRGLCRAEDLAEHFEISVRTVYRDIAHLQASGLPIDGAAGLGYLLRPGFDLPPMTFTYEQLDALSLGLNFVSTNGDLALANAAREVRDKIQSSLPESTDTKLADAPFFTARRDGRAQEQAHDIRTAIRESRILDLHYKDVSGKTSQRRVWPLAVWISTDGWLFAAWCESREDFRSFRLDRIQALEVLTDKFEDHPDRNLKKFIESRQDDR